jgi:hypothetical protein
LDFFVTGERLGFKLLSIFGKYQMLIYVPGGENVEGILTGPNSRPAA